MTEQKLPELPADKRLDVWLEATKGLAFISDRDMPLAMKAVQISGPVEGDWVRLDDAIAHADRAVEQAGGGRDAARYRWLRANAYEVTIPPADPVTEEMHFFDRLSKYESERVAFDAAIDAAEGVR
jgi:hypothetical protein